MNFLLLEPHEVLADGTATLRGRRAEHVLVVLRAVPGRPLRAGVVGGGIGSAVVTTIDAGTVHVRCDVPFAAPAPAIGDVLLLAVPRPTVLLRMLAHAAALGFQRIVLFRSWRVDKSHLAAASMQPHTQRASLLAGLEQAGRTRLPTVQSFALFKPFVEDELPALSLPPARFVAHPTAPTPTHALAGAPHAPFALLLGPERGLLPYEVDLLAAHGFLPITCGPHALRTETALAVLTGQLALLRARASVPR